MFKNVKLIGLSGQKRVGKDTLADYLCSNHGFTKYSFAGPLKKACQEIFMLTDEQTEGIDKETMDDRWGVSARTIFQKVGTELFREKLSQVIPEMKSIEEVIDSLKPEYKDSFKKDSKKKLSKEPKKIEVTA